MFNRILTSLLLVTVTTTTACEGMADDDYQGEILASMTGTVTSTRIAATPPTQAVVIWAGVTALDLGFGGAAINGSFPAMFRIDVTTPPPPTQFIDGSGDLAIGLLSVWPQRGHLTEVEDAILGIEEQHAMLWVGNQGAADVAAARWGMTVEPGMHVVEMLGLSLEQDVEYSTCVRVAEQAGQDLQPCFDDKRAKLMVRYPEVDWSVLAIVDNGDHFRLAADDLDTELSIGLKDRMSEMNFPQMPYDDMN